MTPSQSSKKINAMTKRMQVFKNVLHRVMHETEIIYVSITQNRHFNIASQELRPYKLAITIRTTVEKGKSLKEEIMSFPQEEVYLEDHSDQIANHFIIYCKDAQVANQIVQGFNGATLMSNVRYKEVDKEYLIRKAKDIENKITTVA